MSNEERSRILHRVQPLREQLQQSLRGSLADHERLMRALHPWPNRRPATAGTAVS